MSTLKKIIVKNYRSIQTLEIDIPNSQMPNSNCFGLVGINEAGKSSILKAIALKDNVGSIKIEKHDFKNEDSIIIQFLYELENITSSIRDIIGDSISEKSVANFKHFKATYSINYDNPSLVIENIEFENPNIPESIDQIKLEELKTFYRSNIHHTVFWTADEKHLINKPIPLSNFISAPETISVPLNNCFKLAGIDDLQKSINKALTDPAERDHLEGKLSLAVTNHVRAIWKNDLIEIKLKIYENTLHFLVNDLESDSKSKTVDQRSEGFKQFISFLLTISAESKKEMLQNTILLIDEPETHLHPIAQGNLLEEMWNISKPQFNNISFFATHSNYLISKHYLDNYFHVHKCADNTEIRKIETKTSSYAGVNYSVFGILGVDYINELYGNLLFELACDSKEFDKKLKETLKKKYLEKDYIKQKNDGSLLPSIKVSLQTYIRHLIHHPENSNNEPFTDEELHIAIAALIEFQKKLDTQL
jgi:AAA15 family ATPase/GTPase